MPSPGPSALPAGVGAKLSLVVALALALVVSPLSAPPPPAQAATAAPTGGFALHSGLGGQVDERTGQFAVTVPITRTLGQGDAGVSVALTWAQGRAVGTVDRSGWGAGWTIGNTFVDTAGLKRVYPATGGAYQLDPTEPSGLKHYKLRDIAFATVAGTLPARGSSPAVAYAYRLRYDDGKVDYYDTAGNLAAREDRFGNRSVLTWQARAGGQWRPISITDSFGLATVFDYGTANTVIVRAPRRSDGVVPTTTIALVSGRVSAVTDPVGARTSFGYSQPSGSSRPLISLITAPTGALTKVTYQSPTYQPGLVAVQTLAVTDASNNPLTPVQTFSLDPAGNDRHNYTGYGRAGATLSEEALFESGDATYTYRAGLTTGGTTTVSTYDALHRLVSRSVSVATTAGQPAVVAQTQTLSYPTGVVPPGGLPADFARPSRVRLVESAATSAGRVVATTPRTTITSTEYDDHGRITSATDELGTETTTAYDGRFGLVTRRATTGADGTTAQLVNTLTDDGRNVATSTTAVGSPGEEPAARQTVSYEYDGAGQAVTRTLVWAPGGRPDPGRGGGPDEIVTRFDRTDGTVPGTQDITVTSGYGTDAAQPRTTTIDLASGLVMAATDGLGRRTTLGYDAVGRRVLLATPDQLTTTTAYTPTTTTVTAPDGRVSRTTTDQLGRTVAVTDNVEGGVPGKNPGSRTLATTTYSVDGMSVTATDKAGRSTRRVLDAFGRTVSQTGPSGITTLTSFDDGAAHSQVTSVLPEGSTDPQLSTATTFDDVDRPVRSRTSYPADGDAGGVRPGQFVAGPPSTASFDGLGQPTTSGADDVLITPDRSGPGGVSTSATAAPQDADEFPGAPITATTVRSLSGAVTSRTLKQGDQTSTAVAVVYDASGNIVSAVDPEGRTTRYTYADDGQPLTKTSPSGAVTTHAYDPKSGLLTSTTVAAPGKPSRTITFTRVPGGQPGAGQLRTVSDGTDTITYGYDADRNRTSVRYPDGTSTSATFNPAGQLTTATDVSGAVTTYAYDPGDGSMTDATQQRGGAILASVHYEYDAMGRVRTTTRGNGTVTTTGYTGNNLVASQVTTDAAGKTLEAHSYTYDSHRNPSTRTDTYPAGSPALVPGGPTTWSTVYAYDGFDRLTGSTVYPGPLVDGKPTGLTATSTAYTIDVGGDVTAVRSTRRLPGPRPTTVTSTTTNTIDRSGRLTARQTGSTTTSQEFDPDGNLTRRFDGSTAAYTADGAPQTIARPDSTTVTYRRWPDGSQRSATTTGADGTTSTVVYHYGVDGVLVNDSTSDAGTGTTKATTASYLVTAGREARTLLPGTAPAGSVTGTAGAPTVRGAGVGYYLRDRHSSVTTLLDAAGTVTGGYAYTDYGAAARADGRPVTVAGADGGRTNPFRYLGATPKGPLTEGAAGLLDFGSRQYDPDSGRFTSPDPVDAHNLYQGFRTNPIAYTDLGGQTAATDALIDVGFAFVFLVTAVLTGGAAAAAIGAAAAAVEAGVAITGAVVANATVAVIGTVANVAGAVTSGLLAADDLAKASGGGQLLNEDQRDTVTLVNAGVGVGAGATGLVQAFSDAAVETLELATEAKLTGEIDTADFVAIDRDAEPPPAVAEAGGRVEVAENNANVVLDNQGGGVVNQGVDQVVNQNPQVVNEVVEENGLPAAEQQQVEPRERVLPNDNNEVEEGDGYNTTVEYSGSESGSESDSDESDVDDQVVVVDPNLDRAINTVVVGGPVIDGVVRGGPSTVRSNDQINTGTIVPQGPGNGNLRVDDFTDDNVDDND